MIKQVISGRTYCLASRLSKYAVNQLATTHRENRKKGIAKLYTDLLASPRRVLWVYGVDSHRVSPGCNLATKCQHPP